MRKDLWDYHVLVGGMLVRGWYERVLTGIVLDCGDVLRVEEDGGRWWCCEF